MLISYLNSLSALVKPVSFIATATSCNVDKILNLIGDLRISGADNAISAHRNIATMKVMNIFFTELPSLCIQAYNMC